MSESPGRPLRPIPLAELRLLAEGRQWSIEQRIAGLDSLTPVQGRLLAIHHGTALEISGEAATIITLCCDRCLQHYNHHLRTAVHELVELRGPAGAGAETGAVDTLNLVLARTDMPEGADLDDRLDPAGSFDPERWLFEQLSLQLPLVNRCGDDCPGPATWSSAPGGGDPRWAGLAALGLAATADASESDPGCSRDPAPHRHQESPRGQGSPSRGGQQHNSASPRDTPSPNTPET